jgi:hypothetical protein
VKPNISTTDPIPFINGKIGTNIAIPYVITYSSKDASLSSFEVKGKGVSGVYIPPSVTKSSTTAERAEQLQKNGTMAGSLNLNSTVRFPDSNIAIAPNKTDQFVVTVSIPKDWPSEIIGENILYDIQFELVGTYDPYQVRLFSTPVYLHVVG